MVRCVWDIPSHAPKHNLCNNSDSSRKKECEEVLASIFSIPYQWWVSNLALDMHSNLTPTGKQASTSCSHLPGCFCLIVISQTTEINISGRIPAVILSPSPITTLICCGFSSYTVIAGSTGGSGGQSMIP